MAKITPILLAGGFGTRLWPLSRKTFPKQFSNLVGNYTLFQQSALRLTSSDLVKFDDHIILTNSDFRFIVGDQLKKVGIDPRNILIEPESKNTAAAILAASLYAHSNEPESILLIAPSDHVIPDIELFHSAIKQGISQVNDGKMVTFGILPTHPETAYGYLEISTHDFNIQGPCDVIRFIEKPGSIKAREMLEAEKFLWNAGIFMFKASDIIKSFERFAPDIFRLTHRSFDTAETDIGFLRLNNEYWKDLEPISIDYAIMEKAQNLVAIPFSAGWSDLGSWSAVWSELDKDQSGVALTNGAHAIDCANTLLHSKHPNQQIVGLGLENIIAVAMPDAVLVAKKDRAQDVKKVVDHLKKTNVAQAEIFPKDHRPWGWFESLALGKFFQVKRICVNPGAALSLQSHAYRSEHWIVVEGTAKVTVADETKLISEGQSVYVPLGVIHRMENPGEVPMILIEVQTGSYLGEDDIVRYEDLYARK